jgi:hypothetical protein
LFIKSHSIDDISSGAFTVAFSSPIDSLFILFFTNGLFLLGSGSSVLGANHCFCHIVPLLFHTLVLVLFPAVVVPFVALDDKNFCLAVCISNLSASDNALLDCILTCISFNLVFASGVKSLNNFNTLLWFNSDSLPFTKFSTIGSNMYHNAIPIQLPTGHNILPITPHIADILVLPANLPTIPTHLVFFAILIALSIASILSVAQGTNSSNLSANAVFAKLHCQALLRFE